MPLADNPIFEGLGMLTKATDTLADKLFSHRRLFALHSFVSEMNTAQNQATADQVARKYGTTLALMSPEERQGLAVSSPQFASKMGRAIAAHSGKGEWNFERASAGGLTRGYAFNQHTGQLTQMDELLDPLTGARMQLEEQKVRTEEQRTRRVGLQGDTEVSRQGLLDAQAAEKGIQAGSKKLTDLAKAMQPVQKFIPGSADPTRGTAVTLYPLLSKEAEGREAEIGAIQATLGDHPGAQMQYDEDAGVLRVSIPNVEDPGLSIFRKKEEIKFANSRYGKYGSGFKAGGGSGGGGTDEPTHKMNAEDTKIYGSALDRLNDAKEQYRAAVEAKRKAEESGTPAEVPQSVRAQLMDARENMNALARTGGFQSKYGVTSGSTTQDIEQIQREYGYGKKGDTGTSAKQGSTPQASKKTLGALNELKSYNNMMYEYAQIDNDFDVLYRKNSKQALEQYKKRVRSGKLTRAEINAGRAIGLIK